MGALQGIVQVLHGAFYGQGGPGDMLLALPCPWLACGDDQRVWENAVTLEGWEQASTTTWRGGQKG